MTEAQRMKYYRQKPKREQKFVALCDAIKELKPFISSIVRGECGDFGCGCKINIPCSKCNNFEIKKTPHCSSNAE